MNHTAIFSKAMFLVLACLFSTHISAKKGGDIYVFTSDASGFHTRTVFYDDGKEVVAFDAQFTVPLAEQAIAFLRTQTQHPLRYLVVTHPNPDKFNGIPAFQAAGAKVVMSSSSAAHLAAVHQYKQYYFVQMAKMFSEATYPRLPKADIVFEKRHTLRLANGGTIQLEELGHSGISTNQTLAYLRTEKALIVGDLVHHKAHAWLEGPIVNGKAQYAADQWIQALQEIQHRYPSQLQIYGGRGDVAPLSVAIPAQIAYLKTADALCLAYVNGLPGTSLDERKALVDYAALQSRFEAQFPDYQLGYMIAYGAYGIVASLHE
jgi:glyoxylase-like metal-dependent hydrolase (beta-lactamase superfamily II)